MRLIFFLYLFFASSGFSQTQEIKTSKLRIDSFEITSLRNPGRVLKITSNSKLKQNYLLELGEEWDGELTLKGEGPLADVKVTLKHVNVMSLSDEGPHLDLFNWRTYSSDEFRVDQVKDRAGVFSLDKVNLNESAFPFVSKGDLIQGIKLQIQSKGSGYATSKEQKTAIEKWTKLANKCIGPQTYPCGVGIGSIILSIYAPGDTFPAQPMKELRIILPQGC